MKVPSQCSTRVGFKHISPILSKWVFAPTRAPHASAHRVNIWIFSYIF